MLNVSLKLCTGVAVILWSVVVLSSPRFYLFFFSRNGNSLAAMNSLREELTVKLTLKESSTLSPRSALSKSSFAS